MKEQELEEYLKKITENDADFTGNNQISFYHPIQNLKTICLDAMLASLLDFLSVQ